MSVSFSSFLGHLVFVFLDVSGRIDFAAQPHEDRERSNQSKGVVFEHPVVLEMVSVREQSKFGREGVWVFHLASTHFVCLLKSVGENNQYGSSQPERI